MGWDVTRLAGWLCLGLLACFWVALLNGGPLYYFDTGPYLAQGREALTLILGPGTSPEAHPETAALAPAHATSDRAEPGLGQGQVIASRTLAYGLLLAGWERLGGGWATAMLPQVLCLLAGLGLIAYRLGVAGPGAGGRGSGIRRGIRGLALPLAAAGLSTLPFYAAYLMPDLLAALAIALAALLAAHGGEMRWWERLMALALMGLAAITHLSHLGILAALCPAALILAWLARRPRPWIGAALIGLAALGGVAERLAFGVAVDQIRGERAVYQPFLTARLIVDGPGMDWLDAACARDARLAQCPLHAVLSAPGAEPRRQVGRILFAKDATYGSFLRLPADSQQAIAAGERAFLLAVLRADPLGTAAALLRNMTLQLARNSVSMTLPDARIDAAFQSQVTPLPDGFARSRLSAPLPGQTLLDRAQGALHILSALALGLALIWPRMPAMLRVFGGMVLLGIAANALICGGLSQPAPRYGARVIWLLPWAAALIWLSMARITDRRRIAGT